ncbi:unnamed protein product [Danaus chrysippus]|uniref:(African queen) hypothetical protein n=1 Tax=Danaus chrysippus TaxID=151541 RepID=A0A8J2R285_9NEOP|nr:unnamed protein product [Danaus chrysippus]
MAEENIVNCHYVPKSSLKKVLDLMETPCRVQDKRCKRNLVDLQTCKSLYETDLRRKNWRNAYQMALRRAIYSHNWNQLLYLLKKSPIWEHATEKADEYPIYIRALTILLMNHPSAKSQSLLNDYLHMVLSCRSEQDKKAIYKALLSLTEKIYGRNND